MTYTVMHDITDMRAMSISGVERLMIKNAEGSMIELHMPLPAATALADVFRAQKAGEAAAQRAQEMNAHLPANQRELLKLKGMVA